MTYHLVLLHVPAQWVVSVVSQALNLCCSQWNLSVISSVPKARYVACSSSLSAPTASYSHSHSSNRIVGSPVYPALWVRSCCQMTSRVCCVLFESPDCSHFNVPKLLGICQIELTAEHSRPVCRTRNVLINMAPRSVLKTMSQALHIPSLVVEMPVADRHSLAPLFHNACPMLIILLLRDPHLMKRPET